MAEEEQQDVEQPQETPAEETPEPQAAEEAPEPEAAPEPAEEAPVAEAADETPAAEAETPAEAPAVAEAPAPTRKPKRKRLPRSQRRQRTKPKREKPAERKPIVRLPKPEGERGRKQERRGVVVSNAMDKTIIVQVETVKAHSKYKKVVRRSRRFHAHDAENQANVGDVVRIVETRPLSKTKTWRLAEVVEQAK
jgi:small subunit ribosomal protein S17